MAWTEAQQVRDDVVVLASGEIVSQSEADRRRTSMTAGQRKIEAAILDQMDSDAEALLVRQ